MALSEDGGTSLKRDLGTLESYAVLVGILVGAGIFRVTSEATLSTGPSVLLGHLVLAPVVLATAVAYLVFLSTPMGLEPGGEILHIARTFADRRLTFLAAWLKLIAYLGAGAYLTDAMSLNLLELLAPGLEHGGLVRTLVSLTLLGLLLGIQIAGVRWFGRLQVAMCSVLALSLAVLIVPGLFAIELDNYRPFFTGGPIGFASALPSLFFAYAGFEALSQAAGEVRDSRARLPRVFVRGILFTTGLFVSMSLVAFGVLPSDEVGASGVPMSTAARAYLPLGAELFVTLGAFLAVATSLNATIFVPARLLWNLAREGEMPGIFGKLHAVRRTPVVGLVASVLVMAVLLVSGRLGLALGIAVVALMSLYALHSWALVRVAGLNPGLLGEARTRLSRRVQLTAAWLSVLALGTLIGVRFLGDVRTMAATSFPGRWAQLDLTSLELYVLWVVLGGIVFRLGRLGKARAG